METYPRSRGPEPTRASEAAAEAWPGELHQNETQSCPARAGGGAQVTCNHYEQKAQHLGTSLSPARVVLQAALSSTGGHPLAHSTI